MPFAHAFASMCYETNVNTKGIHQFLMSTKFDLSNDNGPTSNFFSFLYDIKKEEEEEGRKDP